MSVLFLDRMLCSSQSCMPQCDEMNLVLCWFQSADAKWGANDKLACCWRRAMCKHLWTHCKYCKIPTIINHHYLRFDLGYLSDVIGDHKKCILAAFTSLNGFYFINVKLLCLNKKAFVIYKSYCCTSDKLLVRVKITIKYLLPVMLWLLVYIVLQYCDRCRRC